VFKNLFEAPEVEAARLAESPAGSINHSLSSMPVNIHGFLEDLMIEMPHRDDAQHTIIVVPFERYKDIVDADAEPVVPIRLHTGTWRCIVVASDHPSYPVGGHRIAVSEAELVRGTLRTFDLAA
jgi:hypothetical protein